MEFPESVDFSTENLFAWMGNHPDILTTSNSANNCLIARYLTHKFTSEGYTFKKLFVGKLGVGFEGSFGARKFIPFNFSWVLYLIEMVDSSNLVPTSPITNLNLFRKLEKIWTLYTYHPHIQAITKDAFKVATSERDKPSEEYLYKLVSYLSTSQFVKPFSATELIEYLENNYNPQLSWQSVFTNRRGDMIVNYVNSHYIMPIRLSVEGIFSRISGSKVGNLPTELLWIYSAGLYHFMYSSPNPSKSKTMERIRRWHHLWVKNPTIKMDIEGVRYSNSDYSKYAKAQEIYKAISSGTREVAI